MGDANLPTSPSKLRAMEMLEKALAARRQGATWKRSAELAGYSSPQNCSRAVNNYLAKIATGEDVKAVRQMESDRLDELQVRWWTQARTDLKAAQFILQVIDRRIRLHGLDVNEGKIASAAEAQAMVEMATTIALHAHLIAAMTEAGISPEQQDQVIQSLNARIQPEEGDIPGEVVEDEVIDYEASA